MMKEMDVRSGKASDVMKEMDVRSGKASDVIRALHYSVALKRELLRKPKLSIFKSIVVPSSPMVVRLR